MSEKCFSSRKEGEGSSREKALCTLSDSGAVYNAHTCLPQPKPEPTEREEQAGSKAQPCSCTTHGSAGTAGRTAAHSQGTGPPEQCAGSVTVTGQEQGPGKAVLEKGQTAMSQR